MGQGRTAHTDAGHQDGGHQDGGDRAPDPVRLIYTIDDVPCAVDVTGSPPFRAGVPRRLSTQDTDPVGTQTWYEEGHAVFDFLSIREFEALRSGIGEAVWSVLTPLVSPPPGAALDDYHRYADCDAVHFCVVGRTRDLFPEDFGFCVAPLLSRLSDLLGFALTDTDPRTGEKLHIIIRINRPGSGDYNPPHKDMYEVWDQDGTIAPFVNFWIPICGVTARSALPIVPRSHTLTEDRIVRTAEGGVVNGQRYRVRTIASWDASTALTRTVARDTQVLVFSSHLIHGLAINTEPDRTRIALEFRLFKAA